MEININLDKCEKLARSINDDDLQIANELISHCTDNEKNRFCQRLNDAQLDWDFKVKKGRITRVRPTSPRLPLKF